MPCCRDAANASTYSYNDLVRDLDREIESWQQERQKKKGKRAEDISDVVGDLADDFLEFLEMEAGIPLGKTASKTSGAASFFLCHPLTGGFRLQHIVTVKEGTPQCSATQQHHIVARNRLAILASSQQWRSCAVSCNSASLELPGHDFVGGVCPVHALP